MAGFHIRKPYKTNLKTIGKKLTSLTGNKRYVERKLIKHIRTCRMPMRGRDREIFDKGIELLGIVNNQLNNQ